MGQGAGAWIGTTVQVQIPPPQSRTLNPVQNMSKRFSTIKKQMLKWFFLRDDCDILRNLFLEHHMFANEGSIHSNNSRRMNAAAACVLSPLFPVLSSNSVTKSFISDFRVTMSYLARHTDV